MKVFLDTSAFIAYFMKQDEFHDDVINKYEGEIRVCSVDRATFKKAQEILLKFSDHKISFTDATTYVLYKDFALDEIFTLDDDFKKMRLNTSF